MTMRLLCYGFLLLLQQLCAFSASADAQLIDKVYHPYVLANERDVEWRFLSRQSDAGNELAQRIGYGFAFTENATFEAYVIGNRGDDEKFRVRSYEGESRWMLTEQGQYWADIGLLFELERDISDNNWSATSGVMLEKEFGKASVTMNYFLVYGWGDNIESELNSQLRLQYRYRYLEQVQPAVELYTDDEFIGVGPAFLGLQRFEHFRQLKWEAAFILGFNGDARDNTFRLSIEYEF